MADPVAQTLRERSIDTIRFLAVDAVEKARSGHPGLPMGAAAMAYALWTQHLVHDPADPAWPDRDRFVLSAGHGSMLLYALLHLTGYDVSLDDLRAFRQLDSVTPGHPEHDLARGIETTTGPLGQGLATAVGMAIAEAHLGAMFNRPGHAVVDHRTFVLASDGDLMEGVASEAASLAGHLGLGKLIVLYDDNRISIEGSTGLAFTEDREEHFRACEWHVQHVADGNDVEAVSDALAAAAAETARPSLIGVRTHIGFGSPQRQDTAKAHGEPLGPDETRAAKENLGWPPEPAFLVPDDVREHLRLALQSGAAAHDDWSARLAAWREAYPDLAAEWDRVWSGALPDGWDADVPVWEAGDGPATRAAAGQALNAIAARVPELIGGSADLAPSNNTRSTDGGDFSRDDRGGRNLHFGVREHAMAAACNGMALHGGVRPYAGTFFVFTDYMRPALRLGALMRVPVIYVLTHDSIGLGEDGPTHQPVEHLAMMRATPHWTVVRPADANEAAVAWKMALRHHGGPIGLVLTRQKLPVIDRRRYAPATGLEYGGYVLADWSWEAAFGSPGGTPGEPGVVPDASESPQIVLLATGSEVQHALGAYERLIADGVRARVVNLGCWEAFSAQDAAYRDAVLPPQVTARLSVEAGTTFGWERWVGLHGECIGLDRFGASAPAPELFERFGFGSEEVYRRAAALLARSAS
ncbi:MAG: transketolase [Actinobacteria bacterium]|nr:transketolase [Actinomycetota bacterium]